MATRDEVLARLRADLSDINKSRVARAMGKDTDSGRRSLRKWQKGSHVPHPEQAVLLADALGQPRDRYIVTEDPAGEAVLRRVVREELDARLAEVDALMRQILDRLAADESRAEAP